MTIISISSLSFFYRHYDRNIQALEPVMQSVEESLRLVIESCGSYYRDLCGITGLIGECDDENNDCDEDDDGDDDNNNKLTLYCYYYPNHHPNHHY